MNVAEAHHVILNPGMAQAGDFVDVRMAHTDLFIDSAEPLDQVSKSQVLTLAHMCTSVYAHARMHVRPHARALTHTHVLVHLELD